MTFIFNASGYRPEREHCLRMRGLRCDWTKADVLAFARDNGIAGAERILSEVVTSVRQFRALAEKNGVEPIWVSCVEVVIAQHLTEWGYEGRKEMDAIAIEEGGMGTIAIEDAQLEMTGEMQQNIGHD